ncbi:MAG TPA: TauD/TfdA family dioxygenase [Pirellulales bacterium]|nr:TauD/TfdA family dioxygenase [Pirellulales bacterium]
MQLATEKLPVHTEPVSADFGLTIRNRGGASPFDLPREKMQEAFRTQGVVFFQGFQLAMAEFERFSNLYCTDWMTYQGGAHERQVLNPSSDQTVYSVNFYLGQKEQLKFELPLHCDMSYLKISPVALFFFCVRPSATRGETMLCDGAAVYQQLQPSTRAKLHAQRINYIRKYPDGNWQVRFGTSDLDEVRAFCRQNELELRVDEQSGTLTTEYKVSAVPLSHWGQTPVFRNSILPVVWQEEAGKDNSLVRFEDGSPLPPDVIQDIKATTARLVQLIPMQTGDFMFVDNTRLLHGRKGFDDPQREVAIRMAGSLDF